jgi:exodeoxyribonuclease V alpha subunit
MPVVAVRTQTPAGPSKETLAGTVERVTFHNAENGFAVLKVQARGKCDLVTLVGHAPAIGAGEWVTATGIWFTDRQHGLQFKADVLKATPPTGAAGIEKYLASGYMRGIGPAMAKRIVALFGEQTFEIIEAHPERLTEVGGIGPKRAAASARWARLALGQIRMRMVDGWQSLAMPLPDQPVALAA